MTSSIAKGLSARWNREIPARPETIRNLVDKARIELPEEYLTRLRYSNGGEGALGMEPGWFQLWPAEKAVEMNEAYQVEENVPGFFGFGSSGGGEMLAFDARSSKPWKIVMIPFIPMQEEDATIIADSFEAFVQGIGREFAADELKS